MAKTRIVLELSTTVDISTTFLLAFARSIEHYGSDLGCALLPKKDFVLENTFRSAAVSTLTNARLDMKAHPEAARCLYIAPRCFSIKQQLQPIDVNMVVSALVSHQRVIDVDARASKYTDAPEHVLAGFAADIRAYRKGVVPPVLAPAERVLKERLCYLLQQSYDSAMALDQGAH